MIPIPQEQFNMALRSAPRPLRELVGSGETTQKMIALQNKHGISEGDKPTKVSALTAYVLLGLLPTTKFISHLQKDASLDPETARSVAYDIRNNVFAPVAEDLAKLQDKAEEQWGKVQSPQEDNEPTPAEKSITDTPKQQNDESVARQKPPERTPPPNLPTENAQQQGPSPDERIKSEIFPTPDKTDPENEQGSDGAGSNEQPPASGRTQTDTDIKLGKSGEEDSKKQNHKPRKFLDDGTVNLKDERF